MSKLREAVCVFAGIVLVLAVAPPASTAELRKRVVVSERTVQTVRPVARLSARSATQLGFRYETGRGVPQDYVLAAMWYRRAAELGDTNAQHLLGLMYDKGQGVPVDYIEAHKWLNLAAARSSSRNRDYYTRMRNAVASKMPRPDVWDAQWRASHWVPNLVW